MANKIPWHIIVDWKNVTGIIGTLAIIGVVAFFVVLPKIIQNNRLEKYKGETIGTVTSITENTAIDQGHEGTKIYIGSYTVNYYYLVNGQTYNGCERVKATPISTRTLNKISASEPRQLVIRYDESSPNKSTILVE